MANFWIYQYGLLCKNKIKEKNMKEREKRKKLEEKDVLSI